MTIIFGFIQETKKLLNEKMDFRISIALKIFILIGWILNTLNRSSYKLGRLEKDITVGYFSDDSTLFSSERGISAIGHFENERFQIVIASDEWKMKRLRV